MQIENDTIIFKSLPDIFTDEKDGFKPNTVRILSKEEAEEITEKWGYIEYIKIIKSTDDSYNFIRELTNTLDITDALKLKLPKGQRLFVFSWRHFE